MEKQPLIDRMLESENLTDELEDSDANWLLNWGVKHLDEVLQGASDAEAAGERVNALMALIRKINRIVGSYTSQDPADLAEDLSALNDLYTQALPQSNPALSFAASPGSGSPAATLAQFSPRQLLEYLTQAPGKPAQTVAAPEPAPVEPQVEAEPDRSGDQPDPDPTPSDEDLD